MRSEAVMTATILRLAREDARIRAVYLNGSRANPHAEKDPWRDYDIVYVVSETQSFLEDRSWLDVFGTRAILQEPDQMDVVRHGARTDFSSGYTFLMLFSDGVRIDLHLETAEACLQGYGRDTLTVCLLDKDGLLPPLPPPDDTGYRTPAPSDDCYQCCCNEFFWCLNNVAKGLVRHQFPYAQAMYQRAVHPELVSMLVWYAGTVRGFPVTAGMWGKYLEKLLPEPVYRQLLDTYSDGDERDLWQSVFHACELFRFAAGGVADALCLHYPASDDAGTMAYLGVMRRVYDAEREKP